MNQNKDVTLIAFGSLIAIVILGGAAWLVQSEGRKTRETIRAVAKDASGDIQKGVVEGAKQAAEEPARQAREAAEEIVRGLGSGTGDRSGDVLSTPSEVVDTVKDIFGTSKKSSPNNPKPDSKKNEVKEKPEPKESRTIEQPTQKPTPPGDPIKQIFDIGRRATRTLDEVGQKTLALSWDDEQQVGRDVHQLIARDEKVSQPSAIVVRLERLSQPFIDRCSRKEVTYKFYVIENNAVNAFAHAGGYVYVTTGALKFVKSDAELEFFLGHEIAHEDFKHVVKRLTYAAQVSKVGGEVAGQMAQIAYTTIAIGYSKDQELESDDWAFRTMRRAGASRDDALAAMRHLLAHEMKSKPVEKPSEGNNIAEKTVNQINNHFSTHPPTAERLEKLEAIVE